MATTFDVFLCYNSLDQEAVETLANLLNKRNVQPWLDVWELSPGTPWMECVEDVIKKIPTAAVLVGTDMGPWQDREIGALLEEFVERKARVIPVLIPGAPEKPRIPAFLRGFTRVDLRSGFSEKGMDSLVWGITGKKPRRQEPERTEEPDELGAVWADGKARFALFSAHAEAVTLCLFDRPTSPVESRTIPLVKGPDGVWRADASDLLPGQLYGYRVEGPWKPSEGHLFNSAKLLVDPLARAITGEPGAHPSLFAFRPGRGSGLPCSTADSAAAMPKCVLVDAAFDWAGDERRRIPWSETVLYECHVGGFTKLHPEIDEALRGTYLGLASPPVLAFLRRLGVTSLILLPVQQIASEPSLLRRGLRNYLGYSPLGFCAPHAGYATGTRGEQVQELKVMVRELHRAGFEVILEVVFNHSAEGDETGPVLSLKGIDNRTYYRLDSADPRRYVNDTGCGNTLDVRQPAVRRMILESLRYWVREMHVDGFRFNLASVLGRPGLDGTDRFGAEAPLFQAIAADPLLGDVKVIAEPWSAVDFTLGAFPPGWAELNSRYRDTVRGFWRGDQAKLSDLATRLAGSSDVFGHKGPQASVNFITYHNGFTLADLVSYERKHNEANGFDNRDGPDDDRSRNWGAEGPTDDQRILRDRDRCRRNLMASLALSLGVPMLLYGDEIGRTQQGNNNAYCQDNEISWVSWTMGPSEARFLDFVSSLLFIRRRYLAQRRRYLTDEELAWWHPSGRRMRAADWQNPGSYAVAAGFLGSGAADLLLLLNAGEKTVTFQVPPPQQEASRRWRELIDTSGLETPLWMPPLAAVPAQLHVAPFSLRLFAVDTPETDS